MYLLKYYAHITFSGIMEKTKIIYKLKLITLICLSNHLFILHVFKI